MKIKNKTQSSSPFFCASDTAHLGAEGGWVRASWSFAWKSQGGSVGPARHSARGWLCRANQSLGWGAG